MSDEFGSPGGEAKERIAREIKAVMDIQAKAWSAGDLDGYMEHYWKSESLTFSAGGKTTRGWKATRDRYKAKYKTKEQMGRLTFSELEFFPMSDRAAYVLGRWKLKKGSETPGGNFSLVVRKLKDRWLIVHDHSSSDSE